MFVIGLGPLHICTALWSACFGEEMRQSARQRHDAATLEFQLGAFSRLSVTRRGAFIQPALLLAVHAYSTIAFT
jgi:hypothetical protein